MAFWRDDDFEQPRAPVVGRYHSGGVIQDRGHFPALTLDKVKEQTSSETTYRVCGLHNHSGNWVTLLRLEEENLARAALRKCNGSEQPDLDQVVIKWDHFSAYKIETTVTAKWRNPGVR